MTEQFKSDGSTAKYYELPEGATELQDLISNRNMNAQLGEIFRACYRYGLASHSDQLRDARKIRFYIEAEIKRLEATLAASTSPAPIATARIATPEETAKFTAAREEMDDFDRKHDGAVFAGGPWTKYGGSSEIKALSDAQQVEVKFRSGRTAIGRVYQFYWKHAKFGDNRGYDIVEYRVLGPRF